MVVDEVHSYRGIFGSKISLVFRRLNRLAERFGQDPQYVCTSATIANAIEHAATVTGQESSSFELVDEDGSSRGERHWLLWNPPLTKDEKDRMRDEERGENRQPDTDSTARDSQGATGGERRSCHVQSKHLFCSLVLRGYQVACFSNTRQNCEKYAQWSGRTVAEAVGEIDTADFPPLPDIEDPSLEDRVRAYHGSLNGAPRADIETGLRTGAIRGVWSTSALGIGVDIGSLDVVILDGYPGSLMETFQWAGRAGRGDDECLVVLVGGNDPLDQRILEEPDRLFDGDFEKAIVNPENEAIVDDHLVCAADEWPLGLADERWFGDVFPDAVTRLEQAGQLTRDLDETVVWRAAGEDNIQYSTGLRNTGQRIVLRTISGADIGELDLRAALRDAHPNAIYRANGTTYRVDDVDYDRGVARLERYHDQGTQEYTRLLYEKSVEVGGDSSTLQKKTLSFDGIDIPAAVGPMVVSKDVRGYNYYESYDADGQKREFETSVPEPETETTGFLMAMPARRRLALPEHVEKADGDEDDDDGFTSGYLAALHAIEHALIGLLPTAVLCDRQDIGGLSTNAHRRTDGPAIFVHDAHDGGAGLSRAAFGNLETLVERTYDQIAECDCTDGCKRCVLSEYCGSANRDVWKEGAAAVLEQMLDVDDDTD
ncbi:MAG: putative helicase family protein [halophilic archaeon J07HX64]|nr:MAG: putative helicase family protein [halophilic archaeon J07HX64]